MRQFHKDDLVPGFIAAREAKVSRQLLHFWRRSGKLRVADWAPDGRPLYRMGDVWKVERDTRHSPQSSRRRSAESSAA